MEKKRSFRGKTETWLYDHPVCRAVLDHGWTIFVSTVSAFCFAFGYTVFLSPTTIVGDGTLQRIVGGGMSGVSQTLTLAFEIVFPNVEINESLAFSILYFALNIPVIILAWIGIGKRFTAYTLLNVAEVSMFTTLLGYIPADWIDSLVIFMNSNGGMLGRGLFAGVCTGLSTALAFKVDISPGGVDVIAYYIALRKSTPTGKYSMILNSCTATVFFLLTCTKAHWTYTEVVPALGSLFYTALYLLVTALVVDAINLRNKKVEVKVITAQEGLSAILIDSLPHAATLVKAKGAFTNRDKTIITMVVSSYELKDTIAIIREHDPSSFVEVTELQQVYGRFFTRPVK